MRRMRRWLAPPRWQMVPPPAARAALAQLRQANEMLARGDAAGAAAIFESLALRAEAAGIPRAAHLYVLAAEAHLRAGHRPQGQQCLQRAVQFAARAGLLPRLAIAAPRILQDLRAHGFTEEASAFEKVVGEAIAPLGLSLTAADASRPLLPPRCPQCGGSLHPAEVEWVDARSAVCDYCGSIVQSTGG